MSIPEVNRILGVHYLPSSQFDGPSSYDVGSESSEEEGSKTSINSSSTITVSPTFTQETFFQTFDSSGLPSRDTMAERLYLQNFTIQGTIGAGNFGIVKVAQHKPSGNLVALKMVSKEFPLPRDVPMENGSSSGETLGKVTVGVSASLPNKVFGSKDSQKTSDIQQAEMALRWEVILEEYFSMRRTEDVPWTAKLLGSFHDENNFYFVMVR